MSTNPINELKRRLVEDSTPLPKRLCLAKNVINSHHFPTAAKERLVAQWLQDLVEENKLSAEELRDVIGWLSADNLTRDLKLQFAQVVSKYLQKNPIQREDVQKILRVVENDINVNEYLYINITLLQFLRSEENSNFNLSNKILNNLINYYKDSKKKYEFVIKLLDGNNIETIFDYLDTNIRDTVIVLCENVLFPFNKKSFFVTLLKTYIRTENVDDLIAEKGDNIQSVLKIMDVFFSFPKGRTNNDPKFIENFIDMFVSCYKRESQLIFAFYIMASNVLGLQQNYIIPTTSLNQIDIKEKVKRNIFLNMLEILLVNEVDINVRLTDTFGEKISKVETKKTFLLFLQAIMLGHIKLDGKPDNTTIKIINVALKLDPSLIENKVDEILPPIMTAKKNNDIKEAYTEMINCLLDILFKLSRGIQFLNKTLPLLKSNLENSNTEQLELKTKLKVFEEENKDFEKVKSKIITWSDIFPEECVEMYGKLTSELMFRQNKELLLLMQKDFEEYCLAELQGDSLDPSTIILIQLLSAIVSTFLRYSKMADHTVPLSISTEFWSSYQNFEDVSLKGFGECVIRHKYEPSLLLPFLKLCLSFSQLKLLNITYGNTELTPPDTGDIEVYDMSVLLPFFDGEKWVEICNEVKDDESVYVLDKLVLTKIKAIEIQSDTLNDENIVTAKVHLIKKISTHPQNLTVSGNYLTKVLFYNLDKNLLKLLSKSLVKLYLNKSEENIFKNDTIVYNRDLLNALVIQTCKQLTENLDNTSDLAKGLKKIEFDLGEFSKENNMKEYFENMSINNDATINICLDILKELKIYYLEEKYQLAAIFVLLALKRSCRKKMRKNIDGILHNIFELSSQAPDLYKIFPVEYIFCFEDKIILNLLTLKNKTTDNLVVVKSILESAVKRVRSDSELVIKIVDLLLKNHNHNKATSIDHFSDTAFQISCIILPLIAKQKKVLTSSAYRSILADLQEKLHKCMLEAFKNIDFKDSGSFLNNTGNTDDSMVVSNDMAILNAMAAYSLTLSKYCETNDGEEIKNLDCLWSGLEYFVLNAIQSIQKPETKPQHLENSIHLLNITLRHFKKLESHYMFETKDKILLQIWQSLKSRLSMIFESGGKGCLEDIGVTIKFLCELSDVDNFNSFVGDLTELIVLEEPKPGMKKKEDIHKIPNSLKVAQFVWSNCLKANITGPKCVAMTKSTYQSCRNASSYVWQYYKNYQYGVVIKRKKKKMEVELKDEDVCIVKVDDYTCELFKMYLDILTEAILAGKKISIDYKFLDSIFELQQHLQVILGLNTTNVRCEVSCTAFLRLCQGSISILNSLLVAREELLEDRWPCYMQCYRALVRCLCERSIEQPERAVEEKLAETAHHIEKLTQSIFKRKVHISRIAVYTVADICSIIERTAPPRSLRQHIENSVSLLIQASDTTYSVAFLKRALAGLPGQMTMTNLYTMYKRYHKYVGNA